MTVDKHTEIARALLLDTLDDNLVEDIMNASQILESQIVYQRYRVAKLKTLLMKMDSPKSKELMSLVDHLVRRSIWIIGGDGWAYDIGSAGLDHALASGKNVTVLVLDTEVYSNTGGQMSKATPTAATAKFAAAGKRVGKKDLAMQAISYGNVYVAQIAMGVRKAKSVKPKMPVGVCGEHGGDPASIQFFHDHGLDYVSCSPYRVPVARIVAGQAAVRDALHIKELILDEVDMC